MEPEKTPRKRASKFIKDVVTPAWQPSRDQVLWTLRVALVIVVLLGILTLVGLPFNVTLWNWLDLLIVPLVLALGGYLFTRAEASRTLVQADHRRQEDVLQAYLDQMRQLLLNKERPLRQSKANCEARTAARVGTLTTLERIQNPDKKGIIVKFLWECSLLKKQHPVVILEEANLQGADLGGAKLIGANLRKVDLGPDRRKTKPERAKLGGAQLFDADLSGADLREADLSGADLSGANLSRANLSSAELTQAHLSNATLSGADLSGAHKLAGDGSQQVVPNEELEEQTKSLEGATMPDGQKYEEWLQDRKGHGKDGENPDSS